MERRGSAALIGVLGAILAAATLGTYTGWCGGERYLPYLVAGYGLGMAMAGGALIIRFRLRVAMSVILMIGVALIAFLFAILGFAISFSRCFEW